MTMDINRQVQKAFKRLESFYDSDLPSLELKAKLLSELNIALNELNTTSLELQQQNEELEASRHRLEEERSRYQQLYDLAPDGYLVTNDEGVIIEANLAAAQLFRVSRSFLIGTPLTMFVSNEDRFKFRTRLAEKKNSTIMQNEIWEFYMLSGNRTHFPVSVTVAKVFSSSGTSSELRWMIRDITEQKRIEEELQKYHQQELSRSEERFAGVFQASPVMMAILSVDDDRFIDVNQKFLDTMEYHREEVIGHTSVELDIYAGNEFITGTLDELINEKKLHESEYLIRTRSGRIITVLGSVEIIKISDIVCRILAFQDISAKKEMEANIARLDRLNLIGEMAAGIGHEIRNPMTAIRGFLQMLSQKDEYANDLMFFDLMIEELDRANDIIAEYLGLAKKKSVDMQPKYLDEVVKSLYPMLMADANYQEKAIYLGLGKPPMPLIDEKEIRQMILNMARNGLEAMPAGGTLTIGTMLEGDEIVLFIKDEGQGLPPDILDKLGTPFVTTKDHGTGLGLAVCYSIAARHNARIDYETGGEGTTFYVRFPLPVEQTLLF